MLKMRSLVAGLACAAALASSVWAANLSLVTGPQDPGNLNFTLNTLIQAINSGITQQSMAPYAATRNYLDNGAMQVQQRGTGTVTCAANAAITSAAYGADRWGCQANVASGAGQMAVITATPSPPLGFTTSQKLVRISGALTQPVCAWQEIPTAQSTELAGQQVVLSAYVQALAGLAADNANAFNLVIFTGTGTDQGFGTPTASPAITSAWTGVATPLNAALTATTAWVRYQATVVLPTNVTEIAAGICFTPTAAGAGATDGLAFTGMQLEMGAIASSYEFRKIGVELAIAQRYFFRLTETAAIFPVATCSAVDTTHTNCLVPFPVQMRAAPALTFANGFASPTSTTQATLGACTTLAAATTVASTVASTTGALVNCTAATIPAAGIASFLYSNNGTGLITASADF